MTDLKALINKHVGEKYGSRYKVPEPKPTPAAAQPATAQSAAAKPAVAQGVRTLAPGQVHPDILTSYPVHLPPSATPKAAPANTETVAASSTTVAAAEEVVQTGKTPKAIRNGNIHLRLQAIAKESAAILNIDLGDLLSKKRDQHIARRRQMIIYFMVHYTQCTMAQAGKVFGQVDHTSARHAINDRVIPLLESGPLKEGSALNQLDVDLLVGLRKLCQHYGKELPYSEHWPPEEPAAEAPVQEQTEAQTAPQAAAD